MIKTSECKKGWEEGGRYGRNTKAAKVPRHEKTKKV
jgi:hypothetical protein